VAQGVVAEDARLRGLDRTVIEVGSEDFNSPALQKAFGFLHHVHGQGVGFIARGTSGAPDARPFRELLGFFGDDFGKNDLAYGVELGLAAEDAGFSDGDFVEKLTHLAIPGGLSVEQFPVLTGIAQTKPLDAPPAGPRQQIELSSCW
jgi:hypothetical protein